MVQIWYRFPRPGSQLHVPKGMVHPDKQVIILSNGSSEPDWQLSYPWLILPCERLLRGEPCAFLLLRLVIMHCNLAVQWKNHALQTPAQRPWYWAIPFSSVCARLVTHLGHWTRTMKSCPWCISREAQGISIIWLCTASPSLQLSLRCDARKSTTKIQMFTKTDSAMREGSTRWLHELNIHRTRGEKQTQVSTQKVLERHIFPHISPHFYFFVLYRASSEERNSARNLLQKPI